MLSKNDKRNIKVEQKKAKQLLFSDQNLLVNNIQNEILNISKLANTATTLDIFYKTLQSVINNLLFIDSFHVVLKNTPEQPLKLSYAHNIKENNILEQLNTSNWHKSLTSMVFNTAKALQCNHQERNELIKDKIIENHSFSADWLGVPLISESKVIGVLAIQSYDKSRIFNKKDLSLLTLLADFLVNAITRLSIQEQFERCKINQTKLIDERTKELKAINNNLRVQIEERHKTEEQLYFEARHDVLTKLPNRAMFSSRLTYAIKHLKRYPSDRFAVLFIDLDRFKLINDTLGHHAGDLFLIEIAKRLNECVRDNDLLVRLGGDEFVILLDALQSQEDIEEVASRIIHAVEKPYIVDNNTLYSSASIGIALSSGHYVDSDEMLRDADTAMYQAKSMGRGRYVFFDESMRENLIALMTLEQELRIAIEEKQFELHYQKISDLNNKSTIGFEVLLRWDHPRKGLLTPSDFLFLAEETGLIIAIEHWVIAEVSRQFIAWNANSEYQNAFIAINLSGLHLTQIKQLTRLINLIEKQAVDPQRFILEFNEAAFAQNQEVALKSLRKLKKFGVRLALDDYISGLSSFNFLHNYPFEFIKLDRSFIKTLKNNDKNLSLVKALHDLGDQFGYRLVAEGIENEEVMNKLHKVGCDFGQGYYISKPKKIESGIVDNSNNQNCA